MKRIALILLVLLLAVFACINPPNNQEVTEVPEDEMATSVRGNTDCDGGRW